jgi:CDGSH iron-sulfur domain-containing protein 3
MPRIVTKTAHGPKIVEPSDKSVAICMCGLSKNQPFCDGSHNKTLTENDEKMYVYDEKGVQHVISHDCEEECECGKKGECTCGKDCTCDNDCDCDGGTHKE